MPPDSRLALSFNLATYRGEQGFSGAAIARVTDHVWVSGGIARSSVKGSTGGRMGMTFGW
ncbi:YadA C-terminal domain-containing protein [Sphingomonas cannabina]|uniref:YadA-like family protein n=1 Tax=Sphingomonas cannabina TaxID=2899123 RepID=UPI001F29F382|nr:YadA-like family protein [Sphingomonas cannabina]UIJ46258.1 YadA C-terminal domain-containing protein [Sphingomonas cannabina]